MVLQYIPLAQFGIFLNVPMDGVTMNIKQREKLDCTRVLKLNYGIHVHDVYILPG